MAGAVTVSPLTSIASTTTTRLSLLTTLPIYCSFSIPPPLHHHPISRLCKNPRLFQRILGSQLNASEEEEIDELLFDEVSDEEDDTESSLDLLFRFFQSMFKKVSRRAKKASRSILPDVISPQLVTFAVDGVLLLASLSIVKALLEVVCNLGGTVFVVILLLRVIWAAISYFQLSGNDLNKSGTSYSRTQPVT